MSNPARPIRRHRSPGGVTALAACFTLSLAWMAACATAPNPPLEPPDPQAKPSPSDPVPEVHAKNTLAGPWQTWTHSGPDAGAQHELVGKIWSVESKTWIEAQALVRSLDQADYVLLGETHDNADHHRLQAWLVGELSEGRDAVVYEMLDEAQQAAARSALQDVADATPAARAAALGRAVDWQDSGWPAFELYAPVFEAGLAAQLAVVGAGLSRDALAPLFRGEPVDPALRARFGLDAPLDPDLEREWLAQMAIAHCGAMPAAALRPMLTAQRLRDAKMAAALVAQPRALLIAGQGHTRGDRAVPTYLGEATVASIALIEVDDAVLDPAAYPHAQHDFVWFTPRASREDPCAAFEKARADTHAPPEKAKARP